MGQYKGVPAGKAVYAHPNDKSPFTTPKQQTPASIINTDGEQVYVNTVDQHDTLDMLDDTGWPEGEFDDSSIYEEPVSRTKTPAETHSGEGDEVPKAKPRMGCSSFASNHDPGGGMPMTSIPTSQDHIYDSPPPPSRKGGHLSFLAPADRVSPLNAGSPVVYMNNQGNGVSQNVYPENPENSRLLS
jgi:hypothetical protein